jgi:hypothetical protein
VGGHPADGLGAVGRDRHAAARRVVGVRAQLALEALAKARLYFGSEIGVGARVVAIGPQLEQRQRLAVKPVGRPVGGLVGAVAPDRAELLAAGRLPDLLAGQDVVFRREHGAVRGDDALGEGRGLAVDLAAVEAEDHEGDEERRPQAQPVAGFDAWCHLFRPPPAHNAANEPAICVF